MRRVSLFAVLLMLSLGLSQAGFPQAEQGIVIVPPTDEVQVSISLPKNVYQVGEEIQIFIETSAPSVSQLYLNVVDIDAAGRCTLIFPNAFSPNPLVPVGPFVLPDRPTYRFIVVPPTGTEFVQVFASLDPLDLRQLFNTPSGDPFPTLCTNPQDFAAQVQAAIQGIIAVGRIATAFTSFQVVAQPPPNQPPVAQFSVTPPTPLVGQTVMFTSNSFDPDGFITQHFWNFGDGFTATGQTVFHTYFSPGIYQVTLTVTDNRGASSSTTQFLTVAGPPGPPPGMAGFFIDAVDNTHIRISVQGRPDWFTDRPFRIILEADGVFTSVERTVSGNVAPQGIVPAPVGNLLDLTGTVRSGRVDYVIGFSPNTSKIKFDLRLDTNGDGQMERRRDFVFLGAQLKNPPSNPFVIVFPPGQLLPFVEIQVCLVLIDQPGFQFIICFRFSSL
jgi:hypothetical protein